MPHSNHSQTVALSTYGAIRSDIIFGRLAPNAKLKLDDMKAAYKASIPTLRETLNRLASEGFVVAEEQRGFFVAPVSRSDLCEIAELRILLECNALTRSIEKGDTEWEGKVAAAHHKLHRMEQKMSAGDYSQKEIWKRYDWEFHQSLISACGSSNLLRLHAIIFDKYLRYQMLVLTFRGEPAALEHKQLFDAALDRNTDLAEAVLRTHVKAGLEHALSASEGCFPRD
jgi:DNA-binding GntR family transcriptional regulator